MEKDRGRRRRTFRGSGIALAAVALLAAAGPAAAHSAAPSLVSVDVYDRHDRQVLPVYPKDGRRYVVGTPGHEYAVRIRNKTGERVLVVASVDGVNVVTGETASPAQSGYVLEPWGSVEVAGWRKSLERTAAFYFTDLGDSYAARTGRPQDVGVIGVAVFREQRPVISRRMQPDRLAEAPAERQELPSAQTAPAAPPAAAAHADAAFAGSARALSKLGTGHGRSEASYAQYTQFIRASASPGETIAIQYDRRENLAAMGVLPPPAYAQRVPDPFPGRFVPDPR
jgi:hypothetical protein